MRKLILAVTVAVAPVMAIASGADGVWKTEANDDGCDPQKFVWPSLTAISVSAYA